MTGQQQLNYQRIAEAIDFIRLNFKQQPDLDEVAKKVFLSPYHFQRLFSDWAGVSPKKFPGRDVDRQGTKRRPF